MVRTKQLYLITIHSSHPDEVFKLRNLLEAYHIKGYGLRVTDCVRDQHDVPGGWHQWLVQLDDIHLEYFDEILKWRYFPGFNFGTHVAGIQTISKWMERHLNSYACYALTEDTGFTTEEIDAKMSREGYDPYPMVSFIARVRRFGINPKEWLNGSDADDETFVPETPPKKITIDLSKCDTPIKVQIRKRSCPRTIDLTGPDDGRNVRRKL